MPTYDAGSAAIKIKPSFKDFVKDTESELKAMRFSVDVTVGADTRRAAEDIELLRRAASENTTFRMNADTASAAAKVATVRRNATRNASMRVDADTAAALAQVEALREEVRRGATFGVRLGGSGAISGASTLAGRMRSILTLQAKVISVVGAAGLVADLLAIAGAAAKASHALALIPAVGFGGVAGIGSAVTGFSGITGAFQAMSEVSKNASSDANDAIDKANAVSSAQYEVQDANRAATTAQTELNDSYEKAGRYLRDLNDQLEDQKLSTEDAAIGVEEAALKLAKVNANPTSDSITRRRADLSYREAVQRLKEQQEKTQDLQSDTAKANAKGIEGSDLVTAARQKSIEATHRQIESQQALEKALREQASGSSSQSALAKAMDKLSPNAKQLVADIRNVGTSWTDARKAAQDALTGGMGPAVLTLAKQQLPGLKDGMVAINTGINTGLRATLAALSSDVNKADFKTSLTNTAVGFQNAAKGARPLTDAVTKLITVGSEFLPRMGQAFATAATNFNNRIQAGAANGSLTRWIQDGVDAAKTFLGLLRDIGSITASVFRAADAGNFTRSLRESTQELAAFAKGAEGQEKMSSFFAASRERLAELQPLLAELPGLIASVADGFQTWSAIVTPVLKTIAGLMNAQPGLVSAAVIGWLAFRTVGPILTGLHGQVTNNTSALGRYRSGIGTATTAFGSFVGAARGVVTATGGVTSVAGYGSVALGRFGSAVQQLGTHIPVISRMQTAFLDSATAASRFSRTAGTVSAAGEGMRTAARKISTAASGLMGALGGPWGIALAAGGLALLAWKSDADQARRVQEALSDAVVRGAKAQTEFRNALEASGGSLSANAKTAADSLVKANLAPVTETAKEGHSGWSSFQKNVFTWNADEVNKEYDSVQRAIDQNDTFKKVLRDQKLEMSDLGTIVAEGGSKYDNLIAALSATGDAGADVVAKLKATRAELGTAAQTAQDTTPGFSTLTAAVKVLADTAADGTDRLNAMKTILDVLSGKSVSAQDALARYNEQVRETTELTTNWNAAQGTGNQLLDDGKVDTTTANGKRLYDVLKAIRDATADAALAGNELDPILAKNEAQFQQLATATGLDVAVIKELATGIGYLPGDIKILARLQGATEVTQQLQVINEELRVNKDGITIPTKALTDDARTELDKLGVKVEQVTGKPDEIRIVAQTQDALTKLQELIDKRLPDKEQKVNLTFGNLDDLQINVEARRARNPGSGDGTVVTGGHVGGRATGGQLPTTGPGTETRDGILAVTGAGTPVARVDGGEWVVNRQSSKKYNTELAQINAGTFRKLPGHAEGGVIGEEENGQSDESDSGGSGQSDQSGSGTSYVSKLISYAQSRDGSPYGGDDDCSGFQSQLANVSVGREPKAARFSTATEAEYLSALGFKDGVGNSSTFRIGWVNNANMAGGGHTAGTLPNGVAVESGGATSKVMYGGQAIGANDTMFDHRAYLVMDSSGGSGSYVPNSGGTGAGLQTYAQAPAVGKKSSSEITIAENKTAVDTANSERNAVYANPNSTAQDKAAADLKLQKAQNTLESSEKSSDDSSLSLKSIFQKGAGYLADAILSGLGLENSIFSENNTYNKAATSLYKQFNSSGTSGTYSYVPQNLPTAAYGTETQQQVTVSDPSLATQVPSSTGGESVTAATGTHTAAVEKWRPTFASILTALGKPSSWLEPGLTQMEFESGGDQYAVNDNDSDGQGGTQTVYGLMQELEETYNRYRSAQYGGGIFNGASNIAAAINYTSARYGDATTVWGKGHGYADGGRIKGVGGSRSDGVPIWASPDEFIVNKYDAERNSGALEAINAGRWSPVSIDPSQLASTGSGGNSGGTQFITNVNEPRVADVQDLADLVERRAHVQSMGQLAAVR